MLGFIYLVIILAVIILFCWFILAKVAPGVNARKRDRDIETSMRLGVRDAQAQARAEEKIKREMEQ
jgi:predicted ABC-type sugar transport system permease subunit